MIKGLFNQEDIKIVIIPKTRDFKYIEQILRK